MDQSTRGAARRPPPRRPRLTAGRKLVCPHRNPSPLPPWLARAGGASGSQLVEVLPYLLLRQAREALLRRQRLQHFRLLLRRQLWEVFLDELALEVLHRIRHGKALPPKPHEELLQQQAHVFR